MTAAFVAFALDVLILAVALFGAWILVTTGGTFIIAGVPIRAYSLRNPALLVAVIVCLRAWFVLRVPLFLGMPRWDLRRVESALAYLTERDAGRLLPRRRLMAVVFGVIVISTATKLLNAWFHFGFYSGDDVEIQEMSLSHVFEYTWQAWDLRNAFYPMVFIYPVQAALHRMGIASAAVLVFAGRVVVVTFAAVSMWLVYVATRRQFNSPALAAAAVTFLALNKLHVAFASTELPRAVAAAFLTGSYALLLGDSGVFATVSAGVLLGIAASLRFSEGMYLIPAVLTLAMTRRWRAALVVAVVGTATALCLLGLSDTLYWRQPFFSTWNIIDYTLVKGLSTRGYQPVFYYLTSVTSWTDLVTAAFALIGMRYASGLALWFAVPFALLSCLPHKESRFLVPAMPFWSMLAAVGFWQLARGIAEIGTEPWTRRTRAAILLAGCVLVLIPLELEGFRFRRSESAVEVARYLADQPAPVKVGIEDTWRAGGSIYFRERGQLEQFDPVLVRSRPRETVGHARESNIEYLALADEDVQKHGYLGLLPEAGFAEIDYGGKTSYERFRLFKRRHAAGR